MTQQKETPQVYEYYQQSGLLPTHAGFKSIEEFRHYEQHRLDLFANKLKLPKTLFAGSSLLEFGPDSGENALVTARAGATLTLVEPNTNAHPVIKRYFETFDQESHLKNIVAADVQSFQTQETFDIIFAEGFISYIRPIDIWIDKFYSLLKPGGFVFVSLHEENGQILDIFNRVIYSTLEKHQKTPLETARTVFKTKWDSIPHTRSFESWAMDNLQNPVYTPKMLMDVPSLLETLIRKDFNLYSSWPVYEAVLDVYWAKREPNPQQDLKQAIEHVHRSKLSYLLGRKMYLTGHMQEVMQIGTLLSELLSGFDLALQNLNTDCAKEIDQTLSNLTKALETVALLCSHTQDRQDAIDLLKGLAQIVDCLASGKIDTLEEICNTNQAFISIWGQPNHLAVFRRNPQ